ncbi:ATP-binding protein [Desulfoferrobacter suflitae]|uniref:ATP-binding protein n=1 Tax=Desulfoferrobacter suflitae TaxID=2865782 RepID=UPI002164466A|nr:ATP-binding protein [Desulfoferrobacter suflitae]MCK8600515.1 ATP-binding protein [Desulfoferrobacter suflitae]
MFRKAQRKQAKLRLALAGPSGSGKTYSALRIATGLGGPIAVIDTERRSGDLYSDEFNYDISPIDGPFGPQEYISRIKTAERAGYNVLIIDSLSHAWAGTGGILDIKDRVAKSGKGMNDFTAWRTATPMHIELVDTILTSPCHIIATLRTKTAYDVIQKEKKKTKVTKLGLAFIQSPELEYEFTVVLDLSVDGHIATSTKDRTHLFDGKYFVPDEETGRQLAAWLNSGVDPKQELISHIHSLLETLNLNTNAYWLYAATKYQAASIDEIDQHQLQEQINLLGQCRQNPAKLNQFREVLSQIAKPQATIPEGQQPAMH